MITNPRRMNSRRSHDQRPLLQEQANSDNYFEKLDEHIPKSINCKNNKYLIKAAKVASKSSMTHRHGAVIVHKNEVIASGYNYSTSYLCHDYSIHAEVAAISKLKGRSKEFLSECELYVVRIAHLSHEGVLKYSKPCDRCKEIIEKFNIKKTYYSTNYEYDSLTLNI